MVTKRARSAPALRSGSSKAANHADPSLPSHDGGPSPKPGANQGRSPVIPHVGNGIGSPASNFRSPVPPSRGSKVTASMPSDEYVEGGVELTRGRLNSGSSADEPSGGPYPLRPRLAEAFCPTSDGKKAMFLDYDGTLREFEEIPAEATPSEELRAICRSLNERSDVVVHIISGRDASFLEEHFSRYERFILVAEHGYQIKRPSKAWEIWNAAVSAHGSWKGRLRPELEKLVQETPGSHLEEKVSSLVWHYRTVADEAFAEMQSERAVTLLTSRRNEYDLSMVTITHGHKIVELAHQQVRKGLVMRNLCEEQGLFATPFSAVLCAGDDVSDESMFEAAPSDFITIKVGSGPTKAMYRVDNPVQLRAFLRRTLG